jgi:hypothetical protein
MIKFVSYGKAQQGLQLQNHARIHPEGTEEAKDCALIVYTAESRQQSFIAESVQLKQSAFPPAHG